MEQSSDTLESNHSMSDVLGTNMANLPPDKRGRYPPTSNDVTKSPNRDFVASKAKPKATKQSSSANTRDATSTKVPPKSPAKRYPPKRLDQKDQKEFDEFLTGVIQSNDAMYLRMLRYEPIDINDIYAVVGVESVDSADSGTGKEKLTPKVQRHFRDFLDRKVSSNALSIYQFTQLLIL
jgi:hypothetical protein